MKQKTLNDDDDDVRLIFIISKDTDTIDKCTVKAGLIT